MNNLYALIMAGGGGTRLWPLSRKDRPKQMLPLLGDRTMFQISIERITPLIPPERIIIVTGESQVAQLQADAPYIPAENFVVEPFGQNTGPAVGLATLHIRHRDPEAIIAVLAADHHIANQDKFRRVLATAAQYARDDYIVTLGIAPTFPSTGYGYIKRGVKLAEHADFQIYRAEAFTEKPDFDRASEFVLSGHYSWNSGMFIFPADYALREYNRQQPKMHALLDMIAAGIGNASYEDALNKAWPQMPRLSIDYAVMERAERMAVIPVDMGWSDIGSWATLYDVLDGNGDGNVLRGGTHVVLDTTNALIFSDRVVATIGLEDIVIVDTEDVLLVCRRERSQDVKQIVNRLKEEGKDALL